MRLFVGCLLMMSCFKIIDWMLKGKVQMGNDHQIKLRCDQDAWEDCSPEDQVWGWSVSSLEVLHHDCAKFDNKVLCKTLYQGLLDKKAGAPAWTKAMSVKHGCLSSSEVF